MTHLAAGRGGDGCQPARNQPVGSTKIPVTRETLNLPFSYPDRTNTWVQVLVDMHRIPLMFRNSSPNY